MITEGEEVWCFPSCFSLASLAQGEGVSSQSSQETNRFTDETAQTKRVAHELQEVKLVANKILPRNKRKGMKTD